MGNFYLILVFRSVYVVGNIGLFGFSVFGFLSSGKRTCGSYSCVLYWKMLFRWFLSAWDVMVLSRFNCLRVGYFVVVTNPEQLKVVPSMFLLYEIVFSCDKSFEILKPLESFLYLFFFVWCFSSLLFWHAGFSFIIFVLAL